MIPFSKEDLNSAYLVTAHAPAIKSITDHTYLTYLTVRMCARYLLLLLLQRNTLAQPEPRTHSSTPFPTPSHTLQQQTICERMSQPLGHTYTRIVLDKKNAPENPWRYQAQLNNSCARPKIKHIKRFCDAPAIFPAFPLCCDAEAVAGATQGFQGLPVPRPLLTGAASDSKEIPPQHLAVIT